MSTPTKFRRAVDALLKGKTDAAHRLLKSCQPLTPPQSRIWARLNHRIHNT